MQFTVVQEYRNKYPLYKHSYVALMILMEELDMDVERVLEANYVALAPTFARSESEFIAMLNEMEHEQFYALCELQARQQLEKSFNDLAYGEEPPF